MFKKHQIPIKTISLLETQDLLRISVNIMKLQILISITTFSNWNFTYKITIFNYLFIFYWLFPNSISRIIVYIGKTKRHLLVRQYEHLGISVFTEKALKYIEEDVRAIRKHCHENEHRCSVDNFEITGTAVNDVTLKLKEYLLIFKMEPCLNIAQLMFLKLSIGARSCLIKYCFLKKNIWYRQIVLYHEEKYYRNVGYNYCYQHCAF